MHSLIKKILPGILLVSTILAIPAEFLAQTNPPNDCTYPGGCCPDGLPLSFCPGCPPCEEIPVNSELIVLFITGLGLGLYYCYQKSKISEIKA